MRTDAWDAAGVRAERGSHDGGDLKRLPVVCMRGGGGGGLGRHRGREKEGKQEERCR